MNVKSQSSLLHPVEVLRNLYNDRRSRNAHYSLNALSRDLGISPSLLSRIFSGSRNLSLKQGMRIASLLNFSTTDTNLFLLGIVQHAPPRAKISLKVRNSVMDRKKSQGMKNALAEESLIYSNQTIERFRSISQWYHLAILNLTFTQGFQSDASFVAQRLSISNQEAQSAIARLLELGLLEQDSDGSLRKTKSKLYFKTERSETAMRAHQHQMIDKAKAELNEADDASFSKRLINSITFACAEEHVELLKQKINEFQDEVLKLTQIGQHQNVYQLNCQLFPLTKPNRSHL